MKINGETHSLWRAVDHEGEILESYVTKTRDKKAARGFMKKVLRRHGLPEVVTTDGLRSYKAAMTALGNADRQEIGRHANNGVENSRLPFRRRERAMLRFRRMNSLQKFASVREGRRPARDLVMVLLSFKAGLRACEISDLTWQMVLEPGGQVASEIWIDRDIAKYSSSRQLPMHGQLKSALKTLHASDGRPRAGPVIASERGGHMTAHSIVSWFRRHYKALGFWGCSSHSGRRTFITKSARSLSRSGGSLKDVQELAGHRSLVTTERYIAGDRDAQRKLIQLI